MREEKEFLLFNGRLAFADKQCGNYYYEDEVQRLLFAYKKKIEETLKPGSQEKDKQAPVGELGQDMFDLAFEQGENVRLTQEKEERDSLIAKLYVEIENLKNVIEAKNKIE